MTMNIRSLALILAIIGSLNWGLIAATDYNLVTFLFGLGTTLSRIVYGLIGLSGLYILLNLRKF